MKDCPTCGHKLEIVLLEEKLKLVDGFKFADEEVWYCSWCQQYIYEEDFLYNTEE